MYIPHINVAVFDLLALMYSIYSVFFHFVVYEIAVYEKLLVYHALFIQDLYGRLNKICIIFYIFMQCV